MINTGDSLPVTERNMLYLCWLEQHQETEQTATTAVNCCTNS